VPNSFSLDSPKNWCGSVSRHVGGVRDGKCAKAGEDLFRWFDGCG
jgi:hypothetical protein